MENIAIPQIDYLPLSKSADHQIPALAAQVGFSAGMMHFSLKDGRVIAVPLDWFPALSEASVEQRACYEICSGGRGIYWTDIGLALSVVDLLSGGNLCESCWYRISYFK